MCEMFNGDCKAVCTISMCVHVSTTYFLLKRTSFDTFSKLLNDNLCCLTILLAQFKHGMHVYIYSCCDEKIKRLRFQIVARLNQTFYANKQKCVLVVAAFYVLRGSVYNEKLYTNTAWGVETQQYRVSHAELVYAIKCRSFFIQSTENASQQCCVNFNS